MKLLLISPKFDESFWSVRWIVTQLTPERPETLPPLGLATLAALCPPHWEVEIVNENLDPVPLDPTADIMASAAWVFNSSVRRRSSISIGVADTMLSPAAATPPSVQSCTNRFRSIVSGEAEYVSADFCAISRPGCPKAVQGTREVSLQDSPTPRFDLAQVGRSAWAACSSPGGAPSRVNSATSS